MRREGGGERVEARESVALAPKATVRTESEQGVEKLNWTPREERVLMTS